MYKKIATTLLLVILSSCVTLFNNAKQVIEFKEGQKLTKLYINSHYHGYLPQKVSVSRCHDYNIILSDQFKDKYYSYIRKESASLSILSIMMGGLISHASDYGNCAFDILYLRQK
jgi:hypothetical protein|tara:strand:+ start:7784 stop:8128 length:345 start_codon:yes stop_codon:yes gene_type:complete